MKNALVTGASRGIGTAIAEELANKGFRVFVNYNKSGERALKLAEKINGIAVKCDVSSSVEVDEMIKQTEKYGGIDVLVNNAGISFINLLQDTDENDYDRIFDINMKSVYLVTRAVIPGMIRKKYGKIINISSMWGITGASCEACYSASKAAVIGFTKAMAKELGPSGINVNCIAPGLIDTDMNKEIDNKAKEEFIEETPLLRMGTVEDIAKAAAFLTSDDASFITGQVLSVDGGITI